MKNYYQAMKFEDEVYERTWKTIWPERRSLNESQIRLAYLDAVANDEVCENEQTDDVEEMVKILNNIGHYTFGK